MCPKTRWNYAKQPLLRYYPKACPAPSCTFGKDPGKPWPGFPPHSRVCVLTTLGLPPSGPAQGGVCLLSGNALKIFQWPPLVTPIQ